MDMEFDLEKDAANIAKHGVPLSFGGHLFDDPEHLVFASFRPEDGENRYKALGFVDGRLWTAIFVMRGSVTRFISVRKSNDAEIGTYARSPG
jgi:uncharacterized DUF497 family protein